MKKSKTSRLLKLIMAFAIFWMVIGELITYHQKKIFDVRFYDTTSPCIKPKSSDDGHASFILHLKNSSNSGNDLYVGILTQHDQISSREVRQSEIEKPYLLIRRQWLYQHFSLRAPPLSIRS